MSAEPLSRADTAWLHMEDRTHLFMVVSLMFLAEPIDLDTLKKTAVQRLMRYPRLRQVVEEPRFPFGQAMWKDDPLFDIDAHVHRVAVPPPGDQAALEALVADIAGQRLDFSRPLWQWHLVEDYEGGSVLVARTHHAIGDGEAMIRLLLDLTDSEPNPRHHAPSRRALRRPGAMDTAVAAAVGAWRLVENPSRVLDLPRTAGEYALALARMSLYWPDGGAPLHRPAGVVRRVAWTRPIPLAQVKEVSAATGSTVNDVLLAVVAGGLRRHLLAAGADPAKGSVRAMVPVNLRSPGTAEQLGNRFSLVIGRLPVDVAHPRLRVAAAKREMDRLKRSVEPQVGMLLLAGMGLLPPALESLGTHFFASKASLVLTNVPGPRERLYLAGRPIKAALFWEPEAAGIGLGVSIFSYAGEVILGVNADAHVLRDPRRLAGWLNTEMDGLVRSVRATRRAGRSRAAGGSSGRRGPARVRAVDVQVAGPSALRPRPRRVHPDIDVREVPDRGRSAVRAGA